MNKMKYTTVNGVDKPVARMFYGTAFARMMRGEDCTELLDSVFELGFNTFDTARVYQKAELSLGSWIEKRGCREKAVILSKGAHPSSDWTSRVTEKCICEDLEESLRLLRTDYVDMYLLHRDDIQKPAGYAVEILNGLHAQGKIRAFGGSNWTHERIEEANEYAYSHGLIPFTVSSPNYGLAEQIADPWGGGCVTLTGKEQQTAREWYERNQMPVIAYSSLANGLMSGKMKSSDAENVDKYFCREAIKGYYSEENIERLRRAEILAAELGCSAATVALAWMYSSRMNVFAITASSSPERMKENLKALDLELTAEQTEYLNLEINEI